ncbi:MAG: bis(5'-nucleosyl)-tetraphosphatase (symmetrical) YqeK [bacterium]|nr:bis(5'-nucleosyl)-tetraphosphatase (symmetrical) YqeK [bacterium]
MQRKEIETKLETMIGYERLMHSIGSADVAAELAVIHGCDREKAEMAGLLHDCAKALTHGELMELASAGGLTIDEAERLEPGLLHAPVGAIIANKSFGVEDRDILRAIAGHTTGDRDMTCLDKIIYLADAIEPGRTFPGVEELRELSRRDLDEAVLVLQERTINRLLHKRAIIHSRTIAARNDLLRRRLTDQAHRLQT